MSRQAKKSQKRNTLLALMLMGLRNRFFTPEELQRHGPSVVKLLVPNPQNSALIAGLAKEEGRIIADSRNIHVASCLFKKAISKACEEYARDHPDEAVKAEANTFSPSGLPMFGAIVKRVQYAVGHGGFHAGRIKIVEDTRGIELAPFFAGDQKGSSVLDLDYVYDCGSEDSEAFTRSIQAYKRDYSERLEMLFVSHLHADHINRIDCLLGYKEPRIVVLPYLDLEDIAAIALRDYKEGHFSALYREYIRDPILWWRNRGVEIIIFIEPGNDDSAPPDSREPDRPLSGKGKLEIDKPAARLAAMLKKPLGDVPKELGAADPNRQTLVKSSVLAGPGSSFRLEWQLGSEDAWRSADWILLPYVHPVKEGQRAIFRAALLKHLNCVSPEPTEFRDRVLTELRSLNKANDLVDLYSNHFAKDHNAVSLSLYSGPAAKRSTERDLMWHIWDSSSSPRSSRKRWDENSPSGWLSTGDAMLKEPIRRRPWRKFYSTYDSNLGIMTLPHHGSVHNFHEDILDWRGLRLAVATTIKRERRIAGLDETLASVVKSRKHAYIVDDRASQTLDTEARRLLAPRP
jgi:hypothetical protein